MPDKTTNFILEAYYNREKIRSKGWSIGSWIWYKPELDEMVSADEEIITGFYVNYYFYQMWKYPESYELYQDRVKETSNA